MRFHALPLRTPLVGGLALTLLAALMAAQEARPPAPASPPQPEIAPPVMGSRVFDWNSIPAKTTAKGEVRKFFPAPTATLDELECHVTTLNPGEAAHPPHQHPDEEIIVVKEGLVESLVNGELVKVGSGSVIFQAANQMHSIRNAGDTPATYHVIKWNSPGMLRGRLQAKP